MSIEADAYSVGIGDRHTNAHKYFRSDSRPHFFLDMIPSCLMDLGIELHTSGYFEIQVVLELNECDVVESSGVGLRRAAGGRIAGSRTAGRRYSRTRSDETMSLSAHSAMAPACPILRRASATSLESGGRFGSPFCGRAQPTSANHRGRPGRTRPSSRRVPAQFAIRNPEIPKYVFERISPFTA